MKYSPGVLIQFPGKVNALATESDPEVTGVYDCPLT